jgi:hypothetical protein
MQGFLKPYQVAQIKKKNPPGTRIELDGMDGERDMPVGLKGTVQYVDDAGQLGMSWDNGRTLSLIPNEDQFHIIQPEQRTKDNKIRVLVVEPGKAPYAQQIENDYRAMQKLVDGSIEFFPLPELGCHLYCNDKGKLNGLPGNRRLDNKDIICGTFFICADDGHGNDISLNDKQLRYYTERFREPERYTDEEAHHVECVIKSMPSASDSIEDVMRMLGLLQDGNDEMER